MLTGRCTSRDRAARCKSFLAELLANSAFEPWGEVLALLASASLVAVAHWAIAVYFWALAGPLGVGLGSSASSRCRIACGRRRLTSTPTSRAPFKCRSRSRRNAASCNTSSRGGRMRRRWHSGSITSQPHCRRTSERDHRRRRGPPEGCGCVRALWAAAPVGRRQHRARVPYGRWRRSEGLRARPSSF